MSEHRTSGGSARAPIGAPGRPLASRQARLRALRRARLRARRRRNSLFGLLLLLTAIVLGFTLSGQGPGPTGRLSPSGAAVRSTKSLLPSLRPAADLTATTAGKAPVLPFPKKGEGAVAFLGGGVVSASPAEKPVPIASVTKIMTAYLVLRAHPLVGDEQGPSLRFTAADHKAWIGYSENDLSNVELVNGEVLTERQLLEALLIPSADNVADILGRWVSGSEAAFVALMNSTAASLHMTATHYVDDSGVNPGSRSTAADQALLASIVMENPVFRSIVALPDVAFPVAGHIWNYNPAVGVDGIVGVKSGFTQAAGACLVTAAWHKVGDRSVLVVAAVTGQPYGLGQAAQEDEALIRAAAIEVRLVAPFGTTVDLAKLSVPWEGHEVTAQLPASLRLPGWGGLTYTARIVGAPLGQAELRHGWPRRAGVGTLLVSTQYGPTISLPLEVTRAVTAPPQAARPELTGLSVGVGP